MLEFFSILLVQVANFALASSSITNTPYDCLSAEQLCLSIENCVLAWEAHRASCGIAGAECTSLDLETCHSALIGLQTSGAFNRSCLCLRTHMTESQYDRCRSIRQNVFYHPCIPVIKDKYYELYYSSSAGGSDDPSDDTGDRCGDGSCRETHESSPHHIRHQQRKLENGDLQHRQQQQQQSPRQGNGNGQRHVVMVTESPSSRRVIPRPGDRTFPSDEPPKRTSTDFFRGHGRSQHERRGWDISNTSCTAAYRRCQRHVACQRLWDLYRDKCSVQNYECSMTDRRTCREAYEGIKWTGLNACHCEDDHNLHGPECHWIELLTAHNTCIDDLRKIGYINGNGDDAGISGTPVTAPIASPRDPFEALDNTQSVSSSQQRTPGQPQQQKPTSPGGQRRTTTKSTTISPSLRTDKRRPTPTTPKSTTPEPTMPVDAVTMGLPSLTKIISDREVAMGSSHYRIDSTCQRAHAECAYDKLTKCDWLTSEIGLSCGTTENSVCNRTLCAQALRRFHTYTSAELQEGLTFCTCKTNDYDCLRQQKLLFPTCMYESRKLKSCNDIVSECQRDVECRPWATTYFDYCKWDTVSMRCARGNDACRYALLRIRGTVLESDCYCERGDKDCETLQSTMYFRNPCFEDARLRFIPKYTTKKITTSTSTTTSTTATTTTVPPTTTTEESTIAMPQIAETPEATTVTKTTKTTTKRPTTTTKMTTRRKTTTSTTTTTTTSTSTTSTTTTSTTTTPTTTTSTTTIPPTTTPPDKCERNSKRYNPNSYFRSYDDVNFRCSWFCLCHENLTITCDTDKKECDEKSCKSPAGPAVYGSNSLNWVKDRGLCRCYNATLICYYPENYKLDSFGKFFPPDGLYIGVGYSDDEYKWLVGTSKATDMITVNAIKPRLSEELDKIYKIKHKNCEDALRQLAMQINDDKHRDDIILSVVKRAKVENTLPYVAAPELGDTGEQETIDNMIMTIGHESVIAPKGITKNVTLIKSLKSALTTDKCENSDHSDIIKHYNVNSTFRTYDDEKFKCSSFCICNEDLKIDCGDTKCGNDKTCKNPTGPEIYSYNSLNWVKDRGLCRCYNGTLICHYPENFKRDLIENFFPPKGLYIGIGYSEHEYQWLLDMQSKIQELKGLDEFDERYVIQEYLLTEMENIYGAKHPDGSHCKFFVENENASFANYFIVRVKYAEKKDENYAEGGPEKKCEASLEKLEKQINENFHRDNIILSVVKRVKVENTLPWISSSSSPLFHSGKTVFQIFITLLHVFSVLFR